MTAVRSADTAPELRLRRALYAAGVRGWRCHYKGAPGKPDLAWPSLRVAVFVDGAFWHGHISRHKPGRSGTYWDEKIARNVERDREVDAALRSAGWTGIRVWDFEVARELPTGVERVVRVLRERSRGSFGRRLLEARHCAGLTRQELAAASGLHSSTVSAYERGVREPKLPTLIKLARALGVPPTKLVGGSEREG
jgi:DNA mismatch endonuclease, patch repair protein